LFARQRNCQHRKDKSQSGPINMASHSLLQ
jgi:hypothetical protein